MEGWKEGYSFTAKDGKRVSYRKLEIDIAGIGDSEDEVDGAECLTATYIEQYSVNTKFMYESAFGIPEGAWEEDNRPELIGQRYVWRKLPNAEANENLAALMAEFKTFLREKFGIDRDINYGRDPYENEGFDFYDVPTGAD